MYFQDDKLPDDVLRKAYSNDRHSLCCMECNYEPFFDSTVPRLIGKPLWALVNHDCDTFSLGGSVSDTSVIS